MFRPNRIGTPIIHSLDDVRNTSTWAPNTTIFSDQSWYGNAINATPVGDFGRSTMTWDGTGVSIPNQQMISIGQQITITRPLKGDVTGLELNGAILLDLPAGVTITPIFGRLATPAVATWGGVSGADTFTMLAAPSRVTEAGITGRIYQEDLIQFAANNLIAGTYFQAFQFMNTSGGAWAPTRIRAQFSVRQLNDQQNIGYRDTLR